MGGTRPHSRPRRVAGQNIIAAARHHAQATEDLCPSSFSGKNLEKHTWRTTFTAFPCGQTADVIPAGRYIRRRGDAQIPGGSGDSSREALLVDRVPPQSLEAEQSLLGSMLLDKTPRIALRWSPRATSTATLTARYIRLRLCAGRMRTSTSTVTESLRKAGMLERGGAAYQHSR